HEQRQHYLPHNVIPRAGTSFRAPSRHRPNSNVAGNSGEGGILAVLPSIPHPRRGVVPSGWFGERGQGRLCRENRVATMTSTSPAGGAGVPFSLPSEGLMAESDTTVRIQRCLDRLNAGEASARDDLLDTACGRLRELARRMLRDYPTVRRWEETG